MPTEITTQAVEQSTFVIQSTFLDEDGAGVVPNNLYWSLVDEDKITIVNGRNYGSVSTPGSVESFVLQGDDLAILHGKPLEYRYLIIEGDYDSTYGTALPIKDEARFEVVNIGKIT